MAMRLLEAPTLAPTPSQLVAANALDLNMAEFEVQFQERHRVRVHDLGAFAVDGVGQVEAIRVHVGPAGLRKQGGTRYRPGSLKDAVEDTLALARKMDPKLQLRGHEDCGGGKATLRLNPKGLTLKQQQQVGSGFAEVMFDAGLGYPYDTVACDVGSTTDFIDAYVRRMLELGGSPYGLASATCRSEALYGVPYARDRATGGCACEAQLADMDKRGA